MFLTCGVFDEYLHVEKSYLNEIKCVGKGCFSAFKQGINHATIMSFDRDTDQSLKGMHVNSFVAGTFAIHSSTLYALLDRKSTRLNSSHQIISYAVFCLKKKNI